MANDRINLGQRVWELREAAGLTQEDLCTQLKVAGLERGTSVQHLSAVERGATWPSPNLTQALDKILKTNGQLLRLHRVAKVPYDRSGTAIRVDAELFYPLFVSELLEPELEHVPSPSD